MLHHIIKERERGGNRDTRERRGRESARGKEVVDREGSYSTFYQHGYKLSRMNADVSLANMNGRMRCINKIYIYKYSWHVDIYLDAREVEKRERGVLLLFKKFALLCGKKYFTLEGCTAT